MKGFMACRFFRGVLSRKTAWVMLILFFPLMFWGNSIWQAACGNELISFYGRVIDESGKPIVGVEVTATVIYSRYLRIPVMYGWDEYTKRTRSITDDKGNFRIGPVYAYGIRLEKFELNSVDLGYLLPTTGINYRGGKISSLDPVMPNFPDTAGKRITYVVR